MPKKAPSCLKDELDDTIRSISTLSDAEIDRRIDKISDKELLHILFDDDDFNELIDSALTKYVPLKMC